MVTRYKNIDVEIELDEEGYNVSYRQVLASSEILIKQLVNYYQQLNNYKYEYFVNQISKNQLSQLTLTTKFLCQTLIESLKDIKFKKYCSLKMFDSTFLYQLDSVNSLFALNRDLQNNYSFLRDYIFEIIIKMSSLEAWISNFNKYLGEYIKQEYEILKLSHQYDIVSEELARYVNSAKNESAVDLYSEINNDFLKLEKKYRNLFIGAILATLLLTIGYDPLLGIGGNLLSLACSLNSSWLDSCATLSKPSIYPFNGDTLKFVMFKLTVLIVGVTLTTYFLRLSGFYQLKQEQAKQTKLELSAFPDFVSGMDPNVANNLRQELALKYFGKEIDKTMIEKNGDLFQEQIKAGTELIKASAEMVKSVKPSALADNPSDRSNN